jgi:putative restriction endonuclease
MNLDKSQDNKNLSYYCHCFSSLNVYNNTQKGGAALNQPLLLLCVIELISQGQITNKYIYPSEELVDCFTKYWNLLLEQPLKKHSFPLPFWHLKNAEGNFWHLKYTSEDRDRPQTINKLREVVEYAYIDDKLFNLLQEPTARKELIDLLMAVWFSAKKQQIEDVLKINKNFQDHGDDNNSLEISENFSALDEKPKIYFKKAVIRDAFFRKAVVHLYDYRCAFCRLRVTRSLSQTIVDGAHIKQFSQFYDSREDNGISLCKNHHWAFDQGWFSINDDYKIIVASDLQEESPYSKPMTYFHGKSILLPSSQKYFPRIEAIKWHRETVFSLNNK